PRSSFRIPHAAGESVGARLQSARRHTGRMAPPPGEGAEAGERTKPPRLTGFGLDSGHDVGTAPSGPAGHSRLVRVVGLSPAGAVDGDLLPALLLTVSSSERNSSPARQGPAGRWYGNPDTCCPRAISSGPERVGGRRPDTCRARPLADPGCRTCTTETSHRAS